MLTEQRRDGILQVVNQAGSVSVRELMHQFQASESTIRRDLIELDRSGELVKVHGGAMANASATSDYSVNERRIQHQIEKSKIAEYAASLITDQDLVYIDVSTTTACLLDYLTARGAVYVTNGVVLAQKLSERGFRVFIPGGELKASSEAVVGEEALSYLMKYHFSIGFFATNGLTVEGGFSTPELREACIKRKAMELCDRTYMLADTSKFGKNSSITFGDFQSATIITNGSVPVDYRQYPNIITI